jgi:hypothetical protein
MNLNSVIKWTATAITVAGALAVANSWDPLNIYLFNLGSILWVWWAIRIKEPSILVVNLAMLAVYVYGFYVRMI